MTLDNSHQPDIWHHAYQHQQWWLGLFTQQKRMRMRKQKGHESLSLSHLRQLIPDDAFTTKEGDSTHTQDTPQTTRENRKRERLKVTSPNDTGTWGMGRMGQYRVG